MSSRANIAACLLAAGTFTGCYDGPEAGFPEPDVAFFEAEVYPVILRDCGFTECHANAERAFTVYAPGRLRLDPTTELDADETPEELAATYDHARAMLFTDSADVEQAPLLRKPKEGAGHAGLDARGNNVYRHPSEPGYDTLLRWAMGATL